MSYRIDVGFASKSGGVGVRVLVYKRTHVGDPDARGRFGIHDCMGQDRSWHYDAVVGVGGLGAQPRWHHIARKVTSSASTSGGFAPRSSIAAAPCALRPAGPARPGRAATSTGRTQKSPGSSDSLTSQQALPPRREPGKHPCNNSRPMFDAIRGRRAASR
jgi:hypothetical protein